MLRAIEGIFMTRPLYVGARHRHACFAFDTRRMGAVSAMVQDLKPRTMMPLSPRLTAAMAIAADQRRQPARMLAFAGVKTGMKCWIWRRTPLQHRAAGRARSGRTGVVYAQDHLP